MLFGRTPSIAATAAAGYKHGALSCVCRAGSECDQIVPKIAHDMRNMRNMRI